MKSEIFSWPVRVYYEDTDSGGVVYYANYLKFMERARTEWLRAHGFAQSELAREHGVIFVVRDVHITYRRPAVFDDLLQVSVSVHATGRSWIEFTQTVERVNEILTHASVKIVCVNQLSFKPVEIPEIIREKMESRT
ncbi:tol-pal system-associated acyl-CoA thioesterase [Sulfurimicrobium lacus]|uniref:Tol-pal system-associated acyl-CoA thioesterase n=1 Tax=Sulfurimicrobium lacus TaxID=2715678 RepID=A0A6F8V7Y9_9PROT|nr:tol-pal system-associated acyl-CoA thioesterase [Sulfurimicrobium lacus]BCB25808.1 tol-pal system-associated acyl-CoA thioesterase [Sulfurimicrobium lacus]